MSSSFGKDDEKDAKVEEWWKWMKFDRSINTDISIAGWIDACEISFRIHWFRSPRVYAPPVKG